MTEEDLYGLDVNGYFVVREAIEPRLLGVLRALACNVLQTQALADADLLWDPSLLEAADYPAIMGPVEQILGPNIRIDHAFLASEKFVDNTAKMHHSAEMGRSGLYHGYLGNKVCSGLIGVVIALTDSIAEGGFCCIPGSHKAFVPTPRHLFDIAENPFVVTVKQRAGDALIFSEALTHGTTPPAKDFRRLSIFLKYAPGWLAWRRPDPNLPIGQFPATPGYPRPLIDRHVDQQKLTRRQHMLLDPTVFSRGRLSFYNDER